jgi:hypothetical protein
MNSKYILDELLNRYTHLRFLEESVLKAVEAIVKLSEVAGKYSFVVTEEAARMPTIL